MEKASVPVLPRSLASLNCQSFDHFLTVILTLISLYYMTSLFAWVYVRNTYFQAVY